MSTATRVLIESPYHAETAEGVEANLTYARRCVHDSLSRGEAPFASHIVYTQVFDDRNALERAMGIRAGLAWGAVADFTAVYTDLGISHGMRIGIEDAKKAGRRIEYRKLGEA